LWGWFVSEELLRARKTIWYTDLNALHLHVSEIRSKITIQTFDI